MFIKCKGNVLFRMNSKIAKTKFKRKSGLKPFYYLNQDDSISTPSQAEINDKFISNL